MVPLLRFSLFAFPVHFSAKRVHDRRNTLPGFPTSDRNVNENQRWQFTKSASKASLPPLPSSLLKKHASSPFLHFLTEGYIFSVGTGRHTFKDESK